jgi:hypothetical protein
MTTSENLPGPVPTGRSWRPLLRCVVPPFMLGLMTTVSLSLVVLEATGSQAQVKVTATATADGTVPDTVPGTAPDTVDVSVDSSVNGAMSYSVLDAVSSATDGVAGALGTDADLLAPPSDGAEGCGG